MRLPAPLGRLSCEQVVWRRPVAEPILRGVSFAVEPGTGLGIVGPSAAGKSTLCKILVGTWQPTRGSARLDGADLFAWNADLIGRHLGYLPQDVELFAGTVAENIGRLGIDPEPEAWSLARTAGVHEMILALPQGYDTEIGEAGRHLSGGQRQRIGSPGALYGRPRWSCSTSRTPAWTRMARPRCCGRCSRPRTGGHGRDRRPSAEDGRRSTTCWCCARAWSRRSARDEVLERLRRPQPLEALSRPVAVAAPVGAALLAAEG